MAKERIYDSIHVKPTYISVYWIERLIYASICFILVWILSLSLYVSIAQYYQNQILFTTALPLSVLTALIPSSLILLLERILKRLTKKWEYTEFRLVQRFAKALVYQIIFYLVLFFVATALQVQLPSWTGFLFLVLMVIMIAAVLLFNFYNYVGQAVLCFETFLVEFDKKADDTDFAKLLWGARKVAKLAKYYNMEISPYFFSLGMTVSFLEEREQTKKDFKDLIDWIEDSTNTDNFKKFRKLISKYNSVAEKSTKDGIKEKHHWSFESFISLSSAIVVPFAIAIIAIVVPKLVEVFLKG